MRLHFDFAKGNVLNFKELGKDFFLGILQTKPDTKKTVRLTGLTGVELHSGISNILHQTVGPAS